MIMHSNNTNVSRGRLFIEFFPFFPVCESTVFMFSHFEDIDIDKQCK